MKRRALIVSSLGLAMWPRLTRADCAPYPPADEARTSRYVFEGRIVSVHAATLAFDVLATWKGNPPARLTVRGAGRWWPPSDAVGQIWLVFAAGDDDTNLAFGRCGSTGRLPARPEVLAAFRDAGLSRTPR